MRNRHLNTNTYLMVLPMTIGVDSSQQDAVVRRRRKRWEYQLKFYERVPFGTTALGHHQKRTKAENTGKFTRAIMTERRIGQATSVKTSQGQSQAFMYMKAR